MAWISLWATVQMLERQRKKREDAERRLRVRSSGVTHDLRGYDEHCDIPHADSPVFIDDEDELQQEKERIIREIERHGVAMAGLQQELFLIDEKIRGSNTSAKREE